MLQGRAKEVTQNYHSVKEMWKCHRKGQHMYNWSSWRTGESRGEAMFERMLTERCLKVMQDKASSDNEAQQIPNKIREKKKKTEMEISLHALQSSFRSSKTKTKRRAREKKWITYEGWNFNQDLFNSNDNRNQKAVDWYFQIAMKKMSSFNSLLNGRKFYNESTDKDVWR